MVENRKGKLNMAEFDDISDGRVLGGRQALTVGLVDQVGTQQDAMIKAAELGNITAETPDDVRMCPVTIETEGQGGLFSMEGLINSLEARTGFPALAFK